MKGKLDALKQKYDEHVALAAKKVEIEKLQGEMLWSVVQDSERDYEKQKANVEALEAELSSVEDQSHNDASKYEAIQGKTNALQRQIVEIKEALEVEKGRWWCRIHFILSLFFKVTWRFVELK